MIPVSGHARPSANIERLSQLYDPAYVRRVETLDGGAAVQVCLETRMIEDGAGTGVATYARVLARCLPAAGAEPMLLDDGRADGSGTRTRTHRALLALRRSERLACETGRPADAPSQWMLADIFREAQAFFNIHRRLLPIAFPVPPALMHWTYPVPIVLLGARNLYTIHDLIPLTHPNLTSIRQARHGRMLQAIVARADGLVTVSQTVCRQVIDLLGASPERVFNSYQAADAPIQADPPLPGGLHSGRYFLFCGRVEPRKNLDRLARTHAASGVPWPLVIAGPEVGGAEALEAQLRGFERVIRLPWMPRVELLGLMRRARALLFPTLAEGFGLPIAEAMTLGCPVLTSEGGATAEIAGGAALLVPPLDEAAMAGAIAELARDDALCARLRAAGFERARFFSPDVYTRRLRAMYDDVLSQELRSDGPAG